MTDYENDVRRCYEGWADNYFDNYYGELPSHVAVSRDLIDRYAPASILDAGCGPASYLRCFFDLKDRLGLFGFDLTPGMIAEGQKIFRAAGLDEKNLWIGSATDPAAWQHGGRLYDCVTCMGVLPHIPASEDQSVLSGMRTATAPGGFMLVQARNALFSLFTGNRYSRDFIFDELIGLPHIEASMDAKEFSSFRQGLADYEQSFRTDLPPLRRHAEGEKGYDEILSRSHIPMQLKEQAIAAGWQDVEVIFHNIHAVPPMIEGMLPEAAQIRAAALEGTSDWRGHFMASSFILKGVAG